MPMLAPTDSVLPPQTKRKSRIAWRAASAMRFACSSEHLEQHAELIAAEAREGVRGAYPRLQHAGHIAQQPVAGLVAAGIVDDLELVEVDVQQRIGALAALRAEQRPVQAIVELAPVDEAGERVVARLPGRARASDAVRCVTS